jgi:hypothetical protein
VKRLYADDSADSRVKVGNRQASSAKNPRPKGGGFCICAAEMRVAATRNAARAIRVTFPPTLSSNSGVEFSPLLLSFAIQSIIGRIFD